MGKDVTDNLLDFTVTNMAGDSSERVVGLVGLITVVVASFPLMK